MAVVNSDVFYVEAGTALEQHPLSACWPPMDPETFRDLVDSIRDGGIKTPIILYEGKVLDGWHRYNAGVIVGVEIPAVEYDGDDPAGMVIEANQLRRHLAPGERAKAVLACRNWQPSGRPRMAAPVEPPARRPRTNEELAREAGVSTRTISRVRNPQQERLPEPEPPTQTPDDFETEMNAPYLPDDPEYQDDEPPDPINDNSGNDWEDFPDFAAPAESGPSESMEESEDADEAPAEAASQSTQEAPERPARRSVKDQAQGLREDELRQANDDLRQRLAFIEAPEDERETVLENLQLELRTARSRLNELVTENEALKRENAGIRRQLADAEATLEDLENQV